MQAELFSPRAFALAPRALVAGTQPGSSGPLARVWVKQVSAELAASVRAAGGDVLAHPRGHEVLVRVSRLAALEDEDGRLVAAAWRAATRPVDRTRVMGILNVTDDSFSDGGLDPSAEASVARGLELVAEGADILDVGGESTRPGARPIGLAEELERVLPVIEGLTAARVPVISIDTSKARVAAAALEAGACIVNDVSAGLGDPELLAVAARSGAELVLMHMRGTPRTMQTDPRYTDVVGEVTEHLRERVLAAWNAGVPLARIVVDPGIGFGKRLEDNVRLLNATSELRSLGQRVLVGVSRKSFLGALGGQSVPRERGVETTAAVALSTALGADWQRVHDVASARRAIAVAEAVRSAGQTAAPDVQAGDAGR
ncbi:MAG: dihydropteroate synthase [Planctomycetota bacterium]